MSLGEIDVCASCFGKNTNQNRFARCFSPRLSGRDFMRSSLAGHHTFVRVAPPHPSELRPRNCATQPIRSRYSCMPPATQPSRHLLRFVIPKRTSTKTNTFLNGSSLFRSSPHFQSPSQILHPLVFQRKTRPHTTRRPPPSTLPVYNPNQSSPSPPTPAPRCLFSLSLSSHRVSTLVPAVTLTTYPPVILCCAPIQLVSSTKKRVHAGFLYVAT